MTVANIGRADLLDRYRPLTAPDDLFAVPIDPTRLPTRLHEEIAEVNAIVKAAQHARIRYDRFTRENYIAAIDTDAATDRERLTRGEFEFEPSDTAEQFLADREKANANARNATKVANSKFMDLHARFTHEAAELQAEAVDELSEPAPTAAVKAFLAAAEKVRPALVAADRVELVTTWLREAPRSAQWVASHPLPADAPGPRERTLDAIVADVERAATGA
jgi:hypothetical protein